MTDANTGDHVRPTTDAHPDGVYRVVGTEGRVALLQVADGAGRRVHTGALRRVSPSTLDAEFDRAPDPDAGVSLVRAARGALTGLYWSVRRVL